MNDFWNNVSRYPRFFISSLVGLILVIVAPFRNLLKIKKFRVLVPIVFILSIFLLTKILTTMTGL
uniref:Ycf33 n=1 Tax=Cocconeiopsis kantsiensis TaxID=3082010 RepID=UPI003001EC79